MNTEGGVKIIILHYAYYGMATHEFTVKMNSIN
jgi:hypothetical protein